MNRPHSQPQEQEQQFLRRAFDAVYRFDWRVIITGYRRMSRRSKWIILASFASLVLVVVLIQILGAVLALVEERNRPPLMDRLADPYGLDARLAPNVVEGRNVLPRLVGYVAFDIEPVALMPVLECMVDPYAEGCFRPDADPLPVVQHIEAVGFVEQIKLDRLQEEAAAAVIEARLAAEAAATAAAIEQAEAAAATQAAVTEMAATHTDANTESAATEVVTTEAIATETRDAPDESAAGESSDDLAADPQPTEIELTPGLADVRIMAINYLTERDAYDAINTMFGHSRRIGRIGNYVLVDTLPVNYYYSYSRGQAAFVWAHGTWVFWVSADTLARVEDVVKGFPY